ncbi:MAG TPA: hypothetical protein VMU19_01585 [Bryobacteraceae bacterium]|nr:hypothetical protein [Bryobacteraceae bacterium]
MHPDGDSGVAAQLERLKCPRCDSYRVYRSRRRGLVERVIWFAWFPYRCHSCDERFFLRRFTLRVLLARLRGGSPPTL